MEVLLRLCVLLVWVCGCGLLCKAWRSTRVVGKRMKVVGWAALLMGAVTMVTWRLLLLEVRSQGAGLEVFLSPVNCSEAKVFRDGLKAEGRVGVVPADQWFHIVGITVDDMRIHWAFPQDPDARVQFHALRKEVTQRALIGMGGKYAHRVYGYLLPPTTGVYQFQLQLLHMSARGSAEFWLSPTTDPSQSTLLAFTSVLTKTRHWDSADSDPVLLHACAAYYFEFWEQVYDGRSCVEVKWLIPSDYWYSAVSTNALACAGHCNFSSHSPVADMFSDVQSLPMMVLQRHEQQQFIGDTVLPVTDIAVLPRCNYTSRMGYPHKLKEFWGHKELIWSSIYPKTESGTRSIRLAFVQMILQKYLNAFSKSRYRGKVVDIRYMDSTSNLRNNYLDPKDSHRSAGTKILLEMNIHLEQQEAIVHTSEYVYLSAKSGQLCHTSNFQWRKNVDVYLVVSVKDLGLWVRHLIHNVEHIHRVTDDTHLELIIVDYGSQDINIEKELQSSSLPRWKVIKMSGGFSRSGGLQAGIDYVTDPDSIVMTLDMHLTLPPGFVEYTRRHVVQGKMGFAPMFYRLNEARSELNRAGWWEHLTYGLLGLYKSDWTRTGGFDTEKYTTKWGGEDWDAVDKIRSKGYELFRLGYPGLVHYYHSKKGMWGH